jgi:hypothetical protein
MKNWNLETVYENEKDAKRESMILEIWDEKERTKESSNSQNAGRTKMIEEDCLESNEKVMMQEEVIDF